LEKWRLTILRVIAQEYPAGEPAKWLKCRQLEPHIQTVLKTELRNEKGAQEQAKLLMKTARDRWRLRRFEDSERMTRKAIK
jgi:hypothetical protein